MRYICILAGNTSIWRQATTLFLSCILSFFNVLLQFLSPRINQIILFQRRDLSITSSQLLLSVTHCFLTFAGLPAIRQSSSQYLLVIRLPAPTMHPLGILLPFSTTALVPIHTPSPISTGFVHELDVPVSIFITSCQSVSMINVSQDVTTSEPNFILSTQQRFICAVLLKLPLNVTRPFLPILIRAPCPKLTLPSTGNSTIPSI